MKFKNLSSKASLAVGAIILIFGSIAITLTYTFTLNSFITDKTTQVKDSVFHSSQTFEESLSQSKRLSASIAANPSTINILQTEGPSQEQLDLVNQTLNSLNLGGIYSAIYILNYSGVALVSTDKTFVGKDYSFRPYFQSAINGVPFIDVSLGVTSQKLGYYFSSPVKNQESEIVGVVVVKMSPEYFEALLQKMVLIPMTDLLIADQYGVVVSSLNKERIFNSLGVVKPSSIETISKNQTYPGLTISHLQYQLVQNLIENKTPGISSVNFWDKDDGENELIVLSQINSSPLWIVAEVSTEQMYDQSKKSAFLISALVGIAALGAIVFVFLLLSRMLNPMKKLIRMSSEIGGGNFDQTNPNYGGDEFDELGRSMEIMATTLKNRYRELQTTVDSQSAEVLHKNQIESDGKKALINLLEDVEESKNDLEKFKLAVANASDHIVITDTEGTIIFANTAVEKITGFGISEVIGKKAGSKELWGGQMPPEFYKKMWKTIKTDKKVFSGELSNHRKNGDKYIAYSSISPVFDRSGNVIYFVGIERDITHEKDIDRMKTDFISLASHQLRTPLSAMRWFCEMLLAGDAEKLTKEQIEFVNNISLSNARMISLVNSLLNISRIESGRIIVDPEPTDLHGLVKDVLQEADQKIIEKKLQVVVSVHSNLGKIKIDPKLIREVYKNLVNNSIKYTPVGGEISIFISKKGSEVISQVSDTGYGIPKNNQSHIFERFFRAENIIKLETEGTGLGLYLVKAIVESSGGKIWFKSTENHGTSFWFTLPLAGVKAKKGEVTINS